MRNNKLNRGLLKLILLTLIIFTVSISAYADNENGQVMGSFKVDLPKSVNIKKDEYIPIDEVASALDSKLNWELKSGKIEGNFSNIYFSSDKFILANGHLYLPINIFVDNFGIHIEIKGNNYYIYKPHEYYHRPDLELLINTNKERYKRNEDIAVSILLMNKENHDISLQYSSSQEYDLVLTRYNREIWRLSSGKGYLTTIGHLNLRPDEFKLYTELINPSKKSHIYYGTYQLYAEVNTRFGGTIRSEAVEIRFD